MDTEALQVKLFEALESIQIGLANETIYDRFNTLEVADIVNRLPQYLTPYPDMLVNEVEDRITRAIPLEDKEEGFRVEYKALIKDLLVGSINRERLILLIFVLMRLYKFRFQANSISDDLIEVKDYYLSYAIVTKDLVEEVKSNPADARSNAVGTYWVRTTTAYGLVSSRETESKYLNYLVTNKK